VQTASTTLATTSAISSFGSGGAAHAVIMLGLIELLPF